MNWEAFGAIAEGLGAAGVIASLVYLAGQIRQNSRLVRASVIASTVEQQYSMASMVAQDSEMARIYHAGLETRDSLSESDRQRFDALMHANFRGLYAGHQFAGQEVSTHESRQELEQTLRWLVEQPGAQQWWRAWSHSFGPEFCAYVDCLIRETDASE